VAEAELGRRHRDSLTIPGKVGKDAALVGVVHY